MTETQYKVIWDDTAKAVKYLTKKGCFILCDAVPSGFGVAMLHKYKVSDTDEKMRKHISKTYPNAMIEYVDRATVVYGQLERQIALAEYRMSL